MADDSVMQVVAFEEDNRVVGDRLGLETSLVDIRMILEP
jgi:hypothetical protein